MTARVSAIVLAGGRASRLGGISKPGLLIGGSTLLEAALAGARLLCPRIVVVGPPGLDVADARLVREDPPFGGPVAALAAALDALDDGAGDGPDSADVILLLPADLPRAADAVRLLAAALPALAEPAESDAEAGTLDGAHLIDAAGSAQWLTGLYRRTALRAAVDAQRGAGNWSMRAVIGRLHVLTVDDPDGASGDIDTWHDVARYRAPQAGAAAAAETDTNATEQP